jgi:hypothetical protein
MRATAVTLLVATAFAARPAHADPDPRRKVSVLEYRSGSAAMPGIAKRLMEEMSKQTSLQLIGPDQTRTIYGDALDGALVRCAGDAECIAKIGQKVGAAEVVLVGISELGDVILTMQRIDVGGKTVVTRVADSLAASATPSEDQLDGYLARLLAPGDFVRYGMLDIVVNLAGASVSVGGEKRGLTPIEPLKLHAPATYQIRVEKEGYVPFATKVALPPDGEIKVEAELSLRGAGSSWYQHWYVLAGAGILVAGAAGTAIYFGTRDTSSVPVSVVVK